jgi:riboflavin kinase / FMN adenylyltransferase
MQLKFIVLDFLLSKIISGNGIGRTLGFPTLNFEVPKNFKLKEGVYACEVKFQVPNDKEQVFLGILFFGNRKTFDNQKSLELHILDQNLQNPPAVVKVKVLKKIREVKKFENIEDLKKQIEKDCAEGREIFNF